MASRQRWSGHNMREGPQVLKQPLVALRIVWEHATATTAALDDDASLADGSTRCNS